MLKILKQEMLFIPIMMILLELFRAVVFKFYPETALFDRGSELETFLFSVWQITWISSASWLLMRVIFPAAFRALQTFYNSFESFTDEYKQGFSLKLFAVLFFGLVLLLSGKAQSNEGFMRKKLYDTLHTQLYVRELTGKNDGVEVECYLKFVGRFKGEAWCAAFTSYNLNAVGIPTPPNPHTAWAPCFANPKFIIWSAALCKQHKGKKPLPGDCFTLYYQADRRIGHVGFIVDQLDNYFITIEGNTGLAGTSEGAGVHKLKRAKNKIYAVTDYITPYLQNYEKRSAITNCTPAGQVPTQNYRITPYYLERNHTGFYTGERLGCLQRFTSEGEGRYGYHNWPSQRRQKRKGEPAGGHNRDGTVKNFRPDYRWKSARELCLQGFGTKAQAEGKLYPKAGNKERKQPFGKNHLSSKRSSLRPESS